MTRPRHVAALVLAAGQSARLGRNKQLLLLRGEALVCRAVRLAREAGAAEVTVVTGYAPEAVAEALREQRCALVHNPGWADGMGTSLTTGVASVEERADAILVVLPDQILVTAAHLAAVLEHGRLGAKSLVATRYGEGLGAPALFGAAYFDELRRVAPLAGAREVLKRHAADVVGVDEPAAAVDIDTPADLAAHGEVLR